MSSFLDLPLELLPEILSNLPKASHLASTCLVSKTFQTFAVQKLYESVSIYSWQRDGKRKVIQLFFTLSSCPDLARYVRRLGLSCRTVSYLLLITHPEIRDFPKNIGSRDAETLGRIVEGLRNCVNLRVCAWTRDGSLNNSILEALQVSPELRELEINGHSHGQYDPKILPKFANLSKISLIMPSAAVANQMESWLDVTGNTLRNLTLICKTSPVISDNILTRLSPKLTGLSHLHLTGCPKVSHHGVWSVLSSNSNGIVSLALEGVSPKFDMSEFARLCKNSGALNQLRSITLTVHQHLQSVTQWMDDVLDLLSFSPLQVFQIYSTGTFFEALTTSKFWAALASQHGHQLTRFSAHRMLIGLEAIDNICIKCTALEQLFVVVEPDSLESLRSSLPKARRLQTLHLNYPLEASSDSPPVLAPHHALAIVRSCSPTLTQFGCNTRVWRVGRSVSLDGDGSKTAETILLPYESRDIPEPFLVVRT